MKRPTSPMSSLQKKLSFRSEHPMTENDAKRVRLMTASGRYQSFERVLHTCWKKRGDRHAAPLFLTLLKIVTDWADDDEAHTCTIRKHRDHITGKITTSRTH